VFEQVKTVTLRENITAQLVEAILSGRLKPGDRLNESELSRQLQVSRAPIREALQRLQEQGLVVNEPRRGMFVISLSDEELQKINSLRLVLEIEALELCRRNLQPAGRKKLSALLARMEPDRSKPAIETAQLDLEFHRAIWSQAGNEYLVKTLNGLTAPLFAYATLIRPQRQRLRVVLESHLPLMEFVEGRSPEPAGPVMAAHLSLRWDNPARYSSYALKS
jgi:DNA-binding GntR family transcriptional regulator